MKAYKLFITFFLLFLISVSAVRFSEENRNAIREVQEELDRQEARIQQQELLHQHYLEATGSSADRTSEIRQKLEHGICELGPGDFYISRLQMPKDSRLIGSGTSTRLILLDPSEDTYAIQPEDRCYIGNLQLLGASERPAIHSQPGNRHGILLKGNASENSSDYPELCQIENCLIQNFTGGGVTCYDTGYSLRASLNMTDCTVLNCGVGIHVAYFSEYHQFTNVGVQDCYYGCINNGGNNIFTNCSFSGNTVGFFIDNSGKQSPNNSHGSAVGCTFNHSGSNEGIGICSIGAQYGFIFSDCQIFYAAVDIRSSKGIVFDSCNFGSGERISVSGSGAVRFDGCVFGSQPVVSTDSNADAEFHNSFTRSGEPVGN